MIHLLRRFRRPKLRATPLPREYVSIIERNVPHYCELTREEKRKLQQDVQVFLAEKRFEGAGGLEMTDEIRVTIAAQACLLLLGDPKTDYYPYLRNIIVYPSTYVAPTKQQTGHLVTEGAQARLGEAWSQGGNLVLSWDAVKKGCCDTSDAHNVVLHEFAHVLDNEDGGMDGAPLLPSRSAHAPWARILSAEFDNLRRDLARGAPTVLRPYAAQSPAEFFAVATETFFERPLALRERHRALYDQLRKFYNQDPAARAEAR